MQMSSPPRPRRVLRDNISGISKASFNHIALRTGTVRSQSSLAIEEWREKTKSFLNTIIRDAITYTEFRRAIIVSEDDVKMALERNTNLVKKILGSAPSKRCPTYASRKRKSRSPDSKKKHRRDPNVVFIRKVRFYQKQHDCVHLAKLPTERLIREIGQDYKNDLKWSSGAVDLLRYALELYLETLMKAAGYVSIYAGTKGRITQKDIQAAEVIRGM